MLDAPTIHLSEDWRERCRAYGAEIVAGYAAGRNAASRAVSSHGAENDAELQAIAKMGEVALAIYLELDPEASLNWSGRCDAGFDILFNGWRFDAKTIALGKSFLIWPMNKTSFYPSIKAHAFVLVKAHEPMMTIAGWMSKKEFLLRKKIAGKDHGQLSAGTWYMHERDLWDVRDFRQECLEPKTGTE